MSGHSQNVVDGDPEFHETLGRCITRWSLIDEAIFALFHASLQTDETRAAIVYYNTKSLDARLRLTEELMLSHLPAPAGKDGSHPHPTVCQWRRLANDIRALAHFRNSLAHHPATAIIEVTAHADEGRPVKLNTLLALEIEQGFYEKLRRRNTDNLPINQAALDQHLIEIKAIPERLRSFLENLPKAQHVTRKPTILQPVTKTTRKT